MRIATNRIPADAYPFRFDTLELGLITGSALNGKQNDIQRAAYL